MTEKAMIRVIIVDDHAIVRSGLANFLKAFDDLVLVGETASGIEALALVHFARVSAVDGSNPRSCKAGEGGRFRPIPHTARACCR